MPLSQVIMPKTGAEMEEGKIVSWKKQPGEQIKTGEILLEIETDKASPWKWKSPATGSVAPRPLLRRTKWSSATRCTVIAVIGAGSESAAEIDAFVKGTPHSGATATEAPAAPPPANALARRGNRASNRCQSSVTE